MNFCRNKPFTAHYCLRRDSMGPPRGYGCCAWMNNDTASTGLPSFWGAIPPGCDAPDKQAPPWFQQIRSTDGIPQFLMSNRHRLGRPCLTNAEFYRDVTGTRLMPFARDKTYSPTTARKCRTGYAIPMGRRLLCGTQEQPPRWNN